MKSLLYGKIWVRVFEGETEEEKKKAEETRLAAEKAKQEADDDLPKFSQRALNKILADDRRKHEEKVNATVKLLEEAKKAKGLSETERQSFQTRIEELNASLLTKDELAKLEIEKTSKKYKEVLDSTESEKAFWQEQYAGETTKNQILAAAVEFEAVRASQIQDLLMPKTRLVEQVDAEGKSYLPKRFVPKVKLKTLNDKKEEIELDLTIKEAVKRMKDEPENYGNLFKSGLNGGLGAGGSPGGSGGNNDRPPTDPIAYRVWRRQRKGLKS